MTRASGDEVGGVHGQLEGHGGGDDPGVRDPTRASTAGTCVVTTRRVQLDEPGCPIGPLALPDRGVQTWRGTRILESAVNLRVWLLGGSMRPSATRVMPQRRADRSSGSSIAGRVASHHASFLDLQHTAGNRAVQRLLRGDLARGGSITPSAPASRTIGVPAMLRQRPARPIQLLAGPEGNHVQRVELKSSGPGEVLPPTVRDQMERSLGSDFASVRVHPNDQQVDVLGAQAFTAGEDIHFGTGRYSPSSIGGLEMIGHELAHVVQQREGRVAGEAQDGSSAIVRDTALEHEADERGHRASMSEESREPPDRSNAGDGSRASAPRPVIQGWAVPAALKAMGSALAAAGIADKAAVAGAVIAGVSTTAQVGAAIAPGSTGVQSYNLETWNTGLDRLRLERIIQFRLINAHVAHWIRTHPNEPLTATSETKTTTTTSTTTTTPTKGGGSTSQTSGTSTTTADAGPNAPESAIDQAVRAAVARQVEMDVLTKLNEEQVTHQGQQYIWSDSGDHTADTFGTVGAIRFRDIRTTQLFEPLLLSPEAEQIPKLVVPGMYEMGDYRQFRGASLERGEDMETGWNDNLGINLVGGAPKKDEAANDGHGKVTFTTEWNWDDNSTHMDLGLSVDQVGFPVFDQPVWRGEPED